MALGMTITAERVRPGMIMNNVKVQAVGFAVQSGRRKIAIRLANGNTVYAFPGNVVPVQARLEVAAGPVKGKGAFRVHRKPAKASNQRWEGERDGSRMEHIISRTSAYAA